MFECLNPMSLVSDGNGTAWSLYDMGPRRKKWVGGLCFLPTFAFCFLYIDMRKPDVPAPAPIPCWQDRPDP